MGKLDKERLGEAPRSVVTPELLSHMYDKTSLSRDVFVRTNTGRIMPATITNLSPLEIRRAIDGDESLSLSDNIQRASSPRQSEKPSRKDQKPKYNNKPRLKGYRVR